MWIFDLSFCDSEDIRELYDTNVKPGHVAAFSDDCDLASAKAIVRGAGNQVRLSQKQASEEKNIRKRLHWDKTLTQGNFSNRTTI